MKKILLTLVAWGIALCMAQATTFTVPNTNNSGAGSLHQAIDDAIYEGNETAILTLIDETTYDLGATTSANVTFAGNSADRDGGGMANTFNSNPIITNCIFWSNGTEIINVSGTPTVSHSIVQGGYPGCSNCPTGDGNADPLFVDAANPAGPDSIPRTADDGLRLQLDSPAINAGDNSLIPMGITTDITGLVPRIQEGRVDLGAYEMQFNRFQFTADGCNQFFTIPADGDYTFTVRGADGGDAKWPSGLSTAAGGSGASLTATFPLLQGDVLTLVAGIAPTEIPVVRNGGGGGSAIILTRGVNATLLMVAGGGGGAAYPNSGPRPGGGALSTDPDGLPNGGLGNDGGGGGGFNANGGGFGGSAGTLNGGGPGGTWFDLYFGGFGFGGGGSGSGSSGGGGGFSGGNGGSNFGRGEGGTSYVDAAGVNVTRTDGTDGGGARQNGFIEIISESSLAGALIKESNCTTNVTEGGATDTYTVELTCEPADDVIITIAGDAQVSVNPTMLTFTPASWDTPQTVTVTAIDDILIEGSHTGTITHSAASADAKYDNIPVLPVTANITDNDLCPTLTAGSAADFDICSGANASITVNTTNANVNIRLVYFTTAQTGTDMYSGGTALGASTAPNGDNAPFTSVFNNLSFPVNNTAAPITYFVYGILDTNDPELQDANCRPFVAFQVTVNPLPTATVSAGTSPICAGENAVFNLSGTANAEVTYAINSGANQTVNLNDSGEATITINNAIENQILVLVSVENPTTNCSQNLSGMATVVVNQPATVSAGAAQTICQTKTVDLVNIGASIGGGATTGVWSTSGDGTFTGGTAFGAATAYVPGVNDKKSGSVTLTLTTTDAPEACPNVADQVQITILKVDCGAFPWNRNN